MQDIVVKVVSHDDPELRELIARLDRELLERYPGEEIFGVDFDDPQIQKVVFAAALHQGKAIGCGGLRPLDHGSIELKRLFVEPAYRQKGIASHILSFLEGRAGQMGYRAIKLETGHQQPEAIALYSRNGYRHIDRFGEYVDCESSICMEKTLIMT